MSYDNQRIVHAIDAIENYLNNKLPETKLWEHSFIKKQIDRREHQETFTIEDHIRGMVYSMLSSGTKWDRVVDGIDDSTGKITPIDELFHNYDMEYILSSSSDFFTERIKEICGATQSTRKQMEALIKNNIPLLSKIESQYGSIDSCYKKYIAEDSTLKGLIEKLSSPESFLKMNQMGEALNAEYLRNVGYDIAKPDRHIRRILGSKVLGCSVWETVPIYEANKADFMSDVDGLTFKGTLTFENDTISVSITESERLYMPIETMKFEEKHATSWELANDYADTYNSTDNDSVNDSEYDYNSSDSYILSDSSSRELTIADISGLSHDQLELARNEIYARHGRKFTNPTLQNYFDSQAWYTGTIEPEDFTDDMLSDIEKSNIQFIKDHE